MKSNVRNYLAATLLCYLAIQVSGLVAGTAYIFFDGGRLSLSFNFLFTCVTSGFAITVIPAILYSIVLTLIAANRSKGKRSAWGLLLLSCALTIVTFGLVLGAMGFMFGENTCGFDSDNILFLPPALLAGLLGSAVLSWYLNKNESK